MLVDQLPHMLRLGFNEFEVSNPVLIERLEAGRIGGTAALLPADRGKAAEEGRQIFLAPRARQLRRGSANFRLPQPWSSVHKMPALFRGSK